VLSTELVISGSVTYTMVFNDLEGDATELVETYGEDTFFDHLTIQNKTSSVHRFSDEVYNYR
jgi:hypothetical protein